MTCRPLHPCICSVSVTCALSALSGIKMGFLTLLQNSPSVAHPLSQPGGLGSAASIIKLNCTAFTAPPFPSLFSQEAISHPCTGKAKLFYEAVGQQGHCLSLQNRPDGTTGLPLCSKGPSSQDTQGPSLVLISLQNRETGVQGLL